MQKASINIVYNRTDPSWLQLFNLILTQKAYTEKGKEWYRERKSIEASYFIINIVLAIKMIYPLL